MLTYITGRTRLPEVMARYIICVAGLCSYWRGIGFHTVDTADGRRNVYYIDWRNWKSDTPSDLLFS